MNICVATGQCSAGEVCKALRQCVEAVELVRDAEQSQDPARTQHIIQLLRGKVCGKRSDRSICCSSGELNCQRLVEIQQTSKLYLGRQQQSSNTGDSSGLEKIGSFVNIFHDISGDVFKVDSSTLLIRGFTYDGEGPDTFFLAGKSGRPSSRGEYVLPWPADGKSYGYNDNIPLIKRSFDGSEDIVLKMPGGASVDELK